MPAARLQTLGPEVPRTHGPLARAFGLLTMRVLGWRIEGEIPNLARFVIIVAPHTSNWDFPVGAAAKLALGLQATFLGKDTLFRFPLGILMRGLGGIPVDRSRPHDVVSQIVREFATRERLVLAIAPEGTRRKVERWRTGFYHIAHQAQVPIVPVALNWGVHAIQIGAPVRTTGDVERDIAGLQRWYEGIAGRLPRTSS